SEESPNFKANPSSMCKDSSSQAPQNDKEKRNAGVSHPNSRLFPVKHHSDRPHAVPFQCATESPPQGRRIYPAHVSAARPKTARGKRHVPLAMSESAEPREDHPILRLHDRASPESQRSVPIQKNENPAHPSPRCGQKTSPCITSSLLTISRKNKIFIKELCHENSQAP
ncbi:MAG: hypothetical protein II779_09290, partial [Clostridia bacterium]|nr:hypothetical protein [Clostridia bacterium]